MDKKYLHKIKNISFNPVFILGFHRSGTSILYKIIYSTGKFNHINAYDIINYHRLLYNHEKGIEEKEKKKLNKLFDKKEYSDRGIDKLKMEADIPLEYAFLINDNYIFSSLNDKNINKFVEVCKKIQYTNDENKLLLLKNPWDFSNFLFINKRLPNSKFVFIHRNPYAVLNSSLKAVRILLQKQTVYSEMITKTAKRIYKNPLLNIMLKTILSPYFPLAIAIIVEHHAKTTRYFLKNIKKLDKKDYINIRYEDLCSKPVETMGKINEFLNLGLTNLEKYKSYIKPRNLNISEDVQNFKGYIYKRMNPYFRYLNYPEEM